LFVCIAAPVGLGAETGVNYAQQATLESGRLIFTVHSGGKGKETVRRKIWERVAGDAA
jgi:hypothetical protein